MWSMIVKRLSILTLVLACLLAAGCSGRDKQADANRPASAPAIADDDSGVIIEDMPPAANAPAETKPAMASADAPADTVVPALISPPAVEPVITPVTQPAPTPTSRPAASAPVPHPATPPAPVLLPIPRAAPAPESDPNFHIAAGDRALAKDDPNSAVKSMYRAVELDPTRVSSLRALAVSLVAARRFAEVVPIYDSILGMDPNDNTARFNLALALSRVRDFGRAESQYRELLAKDDRSVEGWYNLAMLYQAQGRLEDARQTWLRLIELAPDMASAHNFMGEVYMDLHKPDDAMESFSKAAKLEPGQAVTWVNLAAAAEAAGSFGRAVVAVHKAADIAPDDALFHYRLGELLLDLHRATDKRELLAEAIAQWKQSLKIGLPKNKSNKKTVEKFTKELTDKLAKLEAAATTRPTSQPTSNPA